MERLGSYKVDLKGMSEGTVSYHWQIGDDFFSAIQSPEIQQGRLDVALRVKSASDAYELVFRLVGTVQVKCDRCLELMDLPIDAEHVLRAKLGDEYADDGDWVTVPYDEGVLDVSWNIYEFAALEIPLQHVHPEDSCSGDIYEALKTYDQTSAVHEEDTPIDPRWNELKKILDNNKK